MIDIEVCLLRRSSDEFDDVIVTADHNRPSGDVTDTEYEQTKEHTSLESIISAVVAQYSIQLIVCFAQRKAVAL